MFRRLLPYIVVILVTLAIGEIYRPLQAIQTMAQSGCQTFPQTGKTVCGTFLIYWQQHGGLAQQGYPVSGEFSEKSDTDGKTYTVQYFERAVFERHPENQPPYDVLLSQLGTFQFQRKYPKGEPEGGQPQPTPPPAVGPKLDLVDVQVAKSKFGEPRAIGYIKNNGSVDLDGIQIVATFKDAGGKIVGTNSDFGILLRPNDIYPFSISSSTEFAIASIQLSYREATQSDRDDALRDFQFSDTNVVPPGSSGHAKVVGNVKNVGTVTGHSIVVDVLVTDASGKTLDVSGSYIELKELAPGQTSPFQVSLAVDQVPNFQLIVYASQERY
jgi:hypothetical protein